MDVRWKTWIIGVIVMVMIRSLCLILYSSLFDLSVPCLFLDRWQLIMSENGLVRSLQKKNHIEMKRNELRPQEFCNVLLYMAVLISSQNQLRFIITFMTKTSDSVFD